MSGTILAAISGADHNHRSNHSKREYFQYYQPLLIGRSPMCTTFRLIRGEDVVIECSGTYCGYVNLRL